MGTLITNTTSEYSTGSVLPTRIRPTSTESPPLQDQSGATAAIITLGILFVVSCMVIIFMCLSRHKRHWWSQSPSTIFIQHVDDRHDATSLNSCLGKTLMMDNESCPSVRNPLADAMAMVKPNLMKECNRSPKVLRENVGYGRTFNHSFKDTRRMSRSLETLCNPLYDESDKGFWINCRVSDDDIRINFKKQRGSQRNSDRSQFSSRFQLGSNNLWKNPLFRSESSLPKKISPGGMVGVSNQNYEDMSSPHQSLYGMPSPHAISNTYSVPCIPDDGKARVWPTEENLSQDQEKESQRHIPIEFNETDQEGEGKEATESSTDTTNMLPAISSSVLQEDSSAHVETTVIDMATRPLPPRPQHGTNGDSSLMSTLQESRQQLSGTSLPSCNASSITSQRRVRFEEGC